MPRDFSMRVREDLMEPRAAGTVGASVAGTGAVAVYAV
jgi:hypothetical protein